MAEDPRKSEYGVFSGEDIYAYDGTKNPIIDSILYEKDVICISAFPGVGKSLLIMQMLSNLTTGEPFLETYEITKPQNVLYVQTEGDRAETIERMKNMQRVIKIDNTRWAHMNVSCVTLNTDRGLQDFLAMAHKPKMKFDIIIIDPLYTTVKGSLSDDTVATDWVRNVREIRNQFDCTFIVLHHDGKELYHEGHVIDKGNSNIFGSTFWAAFLSNNYKLKVKPDGTRVLDLGKERSGKMIDSLTMQLVEPSPLYYTLGAHPPDSTEKIKLILKANGKAMHLKELVKMTNLSRATVYRALRYIQKDITRKTENGIVYYKYGSENEDNTSM